MLDKPLRSKDPAVRIRADLYRKIDEIADEHRREGLSRTAIVEMALEKWLAEGAASPSTDELRARGTRDEHAYWHNLLEAVLGSGNESAAVAIQRNLEVFAFTVSLAGQQTPEEFREMLDTFMKANAHAAERAPVRHKKAG